MIASERNNTNPFQMNSICHKEYACEISKSLKKTLHKL